MNEGMAVFLDMDKKDLNKVDAVIQRIDELLLDCGIKYTGFRNVYRSIENKDRDHAVFAACRALNEAAWLKGKLAGIFIMNRTNACSMEQIRSDNMAEPSAAKLEYYENYYKQSHTLAHAVVVDENGQLRDGYTSYLIAEKYGFCPEIYEALAEQPLKKIVIGRHVTKHGNTWKVKSDKSYIWIYTLKNPVISGDILEVCTKKGRDFICVDKIEYVTGEDSCRKYKLVVKHMKERM